MKEKIVFVADDGTQFDNKADCLRHELVDLVADEFERRGVPSSNCLYAAQCLVAGWNDFKKLVEHT